MIKKLQRKFIFLSMSTFFVVLAIIIIGINLVNYKAVIQEADTLLSIITNNKGEFPLEPDKFENLLPPDMSPETPYESRYFSILVHTESKQIILVETSRIISVDVQTAIDYANTALNKNTSSGFLQEYRYQISTESIFTRITFLDCGRKLDAYYAFLFASITISLSGYLIVFALIAFFSNRIIRPISESYEKQKRFITDAGHEIKTPLTIIHADSDILEMEIGENEWISDIKKQVKQLTELTNDLVFLSRMEESQNTLPMIDFPFSEVVSESAASFQSLAQTKGISFTSNIEPMLSFYGNEKSIRQLIGILLDNAIKYSSEHPVVTIKASVERGYTTITIEDNGIGISRHDQRHIFKKFYRAKSTEGYATSGYGIGLYYAKGVVKRHGGTIDLSSAPGQDRKGMPCVRLQLHS